MKLEDYLNIALEANPHDKYKMTNLALHLIADKIYRCEINDIVNLSPINRNATCSLIYDWTNIRFEDNGQALKILAKLTEQTQRGKCRSCDYKNPFGIPYAFCPVCGSTNSELLNQTV